MTESLIQREAQQAELIPISELDAALFCEEEQAAVGTYTGERLFTQRPETYRAAVSLLAEGVGILRIAKLLKVSPSTVIAVRDREPGAIEIEKARLAKACLRGAQLCVEGIVEDLSDDERRKKIPTSQKAITAGILTEKHQLLTGQATGRLERVDAQPGHEAFLNAIAQAIGCGGEKGAQKGAVPAAAGRPGDDARMIQVESRVVEPETPAGPAKAGTETQKEGHTDAVSGT